MQTRTTIPFYYIVGWSNEQKYYIGSRYANGCDPSDLGTKYFTSSKVVKEKWKEQPPDIVQVLLTFETKEQAREWEATALHNFGVPNNPMFLNKSAGTKGFKVPENLTESHRLKISASLTGKNRSPHSDETRAKISAGNKGRESSNKGKPMSLEQRAKLSAVNKGKKRSPHSDETRAKISAGNKGKTHSVEARAKMSTAHKGKTHSEEARSKISASNKGRTVSEDTRAKLSAALKGTRKTEEQRKAQSIATKKWWDERKAK